MTKLTLFLILCSISLQAQTNNNSQPDNSKVYYWFYLKLGKSPSRAKGTNRIYIKSISNVVNSGTFSKFIKTQQDGLMSGKIVIGPFSEAYRARQSQYFYRYAGKKNSMPKINSGNNEEDVYSFFYMKPYFTDYANEIYLERIPSRVATGTHSNFMDMLNEGLNFEKLAVGPFSNYELSEKSKFAYNKIVKEGEPGEIDSLERQNMKSMAKKWKSLRWKIVKNTDTYNPNSFMYRFSTRIPRKYFAPNAVQVITIKATYSESYQGKTNSFTLQGNQVTDNNYVVSSNMSTVYIKTLYFDRSGKEKINGFILESFIYNDTELIELEPVYIKVK